MQYVSEREFVDLLNAELRKNLHGVYLPSFTLGIKGAPILFTGRSPSALDAVEGKASAGRMMHERTVAAIPPVKPLYLFIPTQLLNQSKLFLPKQEGGSHYGIRIGIEICPAT
jgi:hypothetical protein